MGKYRRLTSSELKELEPEFIEFLIIQGIDAASWLKIKQENPERTDELINQFSDVIMEGVVNKIRFLEFRDRHSVRCFQCLDNKIIMVSLETSSPGTDLSAFTPGKTIPDSCTLSTAEKPYHPDRSSELWRMLQNGCHISDGTAFKALCLGL